MTILQQILAAVSAVTRINENFETLSALAVFGRNPATTSGLTWGYYGGIYNGNTIANGTITLADNATNWIVVLRATGVVSSSTSSASSTNPLYQKLYQVTTAGGKVTTIVDLRTDANGLYEATAGGGGGGGAGASTLSVADLSANYTTVLGDANSVLHHPGADTTGRTWTIAANASVAYPTGSVLIFENDNGAGALTLQITSDTLEWVGTGLTGTRTLAAGGRAVALKVAATKWRIDGNGLT